MADSNLITNMLDHLPITHNILRIYESVLGDTDVGNWLVREENGSLIITKKSDNTEYSINVTAL